MEQLITIIQKEYQGLLEEIPSARHTINLTGSNNKLKDRILSFNPAAAKRYTTLSNLSSG